MQRIRSALVFVLAGAIVEVFCISSLHPATFLVFALVGVPLVLVGVALFVRVVWSGLWREPKPQPEPEASAEPEPQTAEDR